MLLENPVKGSVRSELRGMSVAVCLFCLDWLVRQVLLSFVLLYAKWYLRAQYCLLWNMLVFFLFFYFLNSSLLGIMSDNKKGFELYDLCKLLKYKSKTLATLPKIDIFESTNQCSI